MKKQWLQELYPKLNKEELQEIEDRLSSYVELAAQIYKRVQSDAELYKEFKNLTASKRHPTMPPRASEPL
jgi:hypothetical protein